MATADETRDALITALLELSRTKPLSAISVREIARAAGVNHGLVHRHFGSKANLVRAAAQRVADEVHSPGPGRSAATFRYLLAHPELVRVLAQACLEHQDEVLQAAAPSEAHLAGAVDRIERALAELDLPAHPDAHALNAAGLAAILGWVLFKPLLEVGYGIDHHADEEIASVLELFDLLSGGGLR